MSEDHGQAVHVSVLSADGEPPIEPIGWTTHEDGTHVPDQEQLVEEEPTEHMVELRFAFDNDSTLRVTDVTSWEWTEAHSEFHPARYIVRHQTSNPRTENRVEIIAARVLHLEVVVWNGPSRREETDADL